MIELQQIRSVLAVAQERSFTRAAETLWVSRATISDHVRKVEHALGVQLFERTTRQVSLTPAGKVFQDYASRMLSDMASLSDAVRRTGSQPHGTLRLGVTPGVAEDLLWACVADFNTRYPGVEVQLTETTVTELERLIRSGELDLAVLSWPVGRPPADLHTIVLVEEPTGVVLMHDHPLALQRPLTVTVLRDLPFITFVPGYTLREIAFELFRRADVTPIVAMESAVDEAVCGLVRAGLGLSVVTRDRAAREGLAFLPTEPPTEARAVGVAWSAAVQTSEVATALRHHLLRFHDRPVMT